MSTRNRYQPWWAIPGERLALAIEAMHQAEIKASRDRAFRMWSWRAMVSTADPETQYKILNGESPIPEYFDGCRPGSYANIMWVDLDDGLSRQFLEVRNFIAKMRDG